MFHFKLDYISSLEVPHVLKRLLSLAHFSLSLYSPQEAAKYIETFKTLENKSPDRIKEKKKDTFLEQAIDFLTKIPSLNSTDATCLLMHFGVSSLVKFDLI